MNGIYLLNLYPLQNSTFYGLYPRENIIILQEVSSTNDYLKLLLSNIKPVHSGTAIMAKHQTRGKGQRGTRWIAQPDENLYMSCLLLPSDLQIDQAFNLSMLISLAVYKWLSKYTAQVSIKWPNDIYLKDTKIAGILIENQLTGTKIRSAVIGIGININQAIFPNELQQKATSLKIANKSKQNYNIIQCCAELRLEIMLLYEQLGLSNTQKLLQAYNDLLYLKNQKADFKIDGQIKKGIIRNVTANGKLNIDFGQHKATFDLKEVEFVR